MGLEYDVGLRQQGPAGEAHPEPRWTAPPEAAGKAAGKVEVGVEAWKAAGAEAGAKASRGD